jgi:phenylacetate-coenzyme A ligase PaaK-like adenylate-forming protein
VAAPGSSEIFADVERFSLEEQQTLQEEQLSAQIERVRSESRFFDSRIGDHAVRTLGELAELPFVTKAELLAASTTCSSCAA